MSHNALLLSLPGVPESVSEARHAVAEFLAEPASDVVLMVSELVTNAILHTRSGGASLMISVTRYDDDVLVAVLDKGSNSVPLVKSASPTETSGRGLRLVQDYANEWGSAPGEHGGLVWFRASLSQF